MLDCTMGFWYTFCFGNVNSYTCTHMMEEEGFDQ